MLLYDTDVKDSDIVGAGKGLFASEDIAKRSLVALFPLNCYITSEDVYQSEQMKGNKAMIATGVRWALDTFLYVDYLGDHEDFFNHSPDPNILVHMGVLLAKRDIKRGEEMTIDYRYILAHKDVGRFKDAEGNLIDGLPAEESHVESAKELIDLFGGSI